MQESADRKRFQSIIWCQSAKNGLKVLSGSRRPMTTGAHTKRAHSSKAIVASMPTARVHRQENDCHSLIAKREAKISRLSSLYFSFTNSMAYTIHILL